MKNSFKKLSVLILFAVLISFNGCFDTSYIDEISNASTTTPANQEQVSIDKISINLPYAVSDSLNPFLAKTEINRALTPLLFDSLFSVGNDFKAIPLIASSYTQDNNGITVTLKSGLTFTDSSPITANDVVYSFDIAKSSERYGSTLKCFKKAEIGASNTVRFLFSNQCQDAVNLLTFPIIKSNTYNGTSEDKFNLPIGCGKYYLTKGSDNIFYLSCYSSRLGVFKPNYKCLGLEGITESNSIASSFSLGHSNIIIDTLSSGNYNQIAGATNKITMTNFVYLVCNKNNTAFKIPEVKKAINLVLDRQEICDHSFIGFAVPTDSPFHPNYYKITEKPDLTPAPTIAEEILKKAGFTNINPEYKFRYSDDKTVLQFTLAVNKDNSFKLSAAEKIKEQLEKLNIIVNIAKYNEADFIKAVSSGKYDMYIGECKLKNSLDLSEFFTSGSSVSYGIDTACAAGDFYKNYCSGTAKIDDVITSFNDEMPFIPLLYRSGSAISNSAMSVANDTIVTDYYNNAEKWKNIND